MKKTAEYNTIAEWERAAKLRDDLEITEFETEERRVLSASGFISTDSDIFRVRWNHDGHCYMRSLRLHGFDIPINDSDDFKA